MIVRTKLARAKQTDIAFGICFTSLQSRSSLRDDRKRTACSETRATHTHTRTTPTLRGVVNSTTEQAPLVQRHARDKTKHASLSGALSLSPIVKSIGLLDGRRGGALSATRSRLIFLSPLSKKLA